MLILLWAQHSNKLKTQLKEYTSAVTLKTLKIYNSTIMTLGARGANECSINDHIVNSMIIKYALS